MIIKDLYGNTVREINITPEVEITKHDITKHNHFYKLGRKPNTIQEWLDEISDTRLRNKIEKLMEEQPLPRLKPKPKNVYTMFAESFNWSDLTNKQLDIFLEDFDRLNPYGNTFVNRSVTLKSRELPSHFYVKEKAEDFVKTLNPSAKLITIVLSYSHTSNDIIEMLIGNLSLPKGTLFKIPKDLHLSDKSKVKVYDHVLGRIFYMV